MRMIEATEAMQQMGKAMRRTMPQIDREAWARAFALPVGTKVEIVPHQPETTWPGGVGTIVEICPAQGGYLVQHPTGKFGWCWDEVIRARPWWKRVLFKAKRED